MIETLEMSKDDFDAYEKQVLKVLTWLISIAPMNYTKELQTLKQLAVKARLGDSEEYENQVDKLITIMVSNAMGFQTTSLHSQTGQKT